MKKKVLYIGLVLLFLASLLLVLTDNAYFIDDSIHNFLYHDNLVDFMKIITFLGGEIGVPIITGIIFIYLFIRKNKKDAIGLLIVVIGITIVNTIIKIIVARQRPDYILVIEKSASFPSG